MMLVTGTGATGEQAYLIGKDAIDDYGHPSCYVDFPDATTADIQVSVQYLVWGLRREFALSGRKVAVFGISQGGPASQDGADLLAGPAEQGVGRARRRREPSTGATSASGRPIRARRRPVHPGGLAAGAGLETAQRR